MTGLRKYVPMFWRGTVENVLEFPILGDRKEGMFWRLNTARDIADTYLGTRQSFVVRDGVNTVYTATGHQTVGNANYAKIVGVGTTFGTHAPVGSKISINGEERWVVTVTGATDITLNLPLDTEIAVAVAVIYSTIKPDNAGAKTAYVSSTHANPVASTYALIDGAATAFNTELVVGDVIQITLADLSTHVRTVAIITNATSMNLDVGMEAAIIVGATYKKLESDGTWSAALTGTMTTNVNHFIYTNPYYKHLYSANTAFSALIAGDKVTIVNPTTSTALERIIDTVVSSGDVIITEPITGSLTALTDAGLAKNLMTSEVGYLISNTGNSNDSKVLLWTETSSGYGWVAMTEENLDGTSPALIKFDSAPVQGVATYTECTIGVGVPANGRYVTFGTEIYEFNTGAVTAGRIKVDTTGAASVTDAAVALKTAFNTNTSYDVTATNLAGVAKFTANSLYEDYNTLPTLANAGGNITWAAATFGDGGGNSTTGVNATIGHKGEQLIATTTLWVCILNNLDVTNTDSVATHWKSVALT